MSAALPASKDSTNTENRFYSRPPDSNPALHNDSTDTGNRFYSHPPNLNPTLHDAAAYDANSQILPKASESQPLPSPQPISLSDNPDAIALRATMSILQIQRQQTLRDMKTLEVQKGKALEHPEQFAQDVRDGKIKVRGTEGVMPRAEDSDGAEEGRESTESRNDGEGHAGESGHETEPFGAIPSAQNVVRMPPVNWAKYHIVGESLDKLHDEQRARPTLGTPSRDDDLRPRERAQESVIAAPYNPWTDKLDDKSHKSKGGARKKG